jgi:hypothetical protein
MSTTTETIKQLEFWGDTIMSKTLVVLLYGTTREEEDEFANELELRLMENGLKENYFVQATQDELRFTIENNLIPPDCIIVKDNRKEYNESFLEWLRKDCNIVSINLGTRKKFDYTFIEDLDFYYGVNYIAKDILKGG